MDNQRIEGVYVVLVPAPTTPTNTIKEICDFCGKEMILEEIYKEKNKTIFKGKCVCGAIWKSIF